MKIGCDIVYLPRFQKILARTPSMRRRIFLPQEEKGASRKKLAGIFAAKEAVIKALRLKAGDWLEIEILHEKNGGPRLALHKKISAKFTAHDLSISHDGDYTMACVIFFL